MSYLREKPVEKERKERNRSGRSQYGPEAEEEADRLRRRASFLRERAEARELMRRVTPHRSKVARLRQAMRMRSFRT
jgi:hypothetical protein